MTKIIFKWLALATALSVSASNVLAEARVTYKSAKAGSSYYQMGVEIASMGPLLPLNNSPFVFSLSQPKTALLVTAFVLPVD